MLSLDDYVAGEVSWLLQVHLDQIKTLPGQLDRLSLDKIAGLTRTKINCFDCMRPYYSFQNNCLLIYFEKYIP